jgi:hypothetical protein
MVEPAIPVKQRRDRTRGGAAWLVAGVAAISFLVWFWFARVVATPEKFQLFSTADLYTYFYPMADYAARLAREGHLFLWNPHQLAGVPGLATWQVGALYPGHLPYLWLSIERGMASMALGHAMFAAVGTLLFARSLGASPLGAATAAGYFGLAGVLARFSWPPGMEAMAWFPMGLFCLHRFLERRTVGRALVYAVCVTMPILAGGYQTAVFMLLAFALYMVVATFPGALRNPREAGAAILGTGAATGLGLLCAAPQLLPTLELLGAAARSFEKLEVAQVVVDRGAEAAPTLVVLGDSLRSASELLTMSVHIGAIPALLASLAVILRPSRTVAFAVSLVIYGYLSLVGPDWFLAARAQVPGVASLRLPIREFFLAQFGVALLIAAALSAERLQAGLGGRAALAAVVVAIVALIGPAGIGLFVAGGLAVAAIAVAVLVACPAGSIASRSALLLLATLALADVSALTVNSYQTPYSGEGVAPLYRDAAFHERAKELAQSRRALVMSRLGSRARLPKSAQIFGYDSPVDYDPLALAAHASCFTAAAPDAVAATTDKWGYSGSLPFPVARQKGALVPPGKRCLDLLSVEILGSAALSYLDADFRKHWTYATDERFADDNSNPTSVLYRNREALPRAFAVHNRECFAKEQAAWARLVDPMFDPRTTVVLDGLENCKVDFANSPVQSSNVQIVRHEPTEVVLETRMRAPGYVVLTDSFYPGWRAFVNGKRADVLKANGTVRAVRVPQGRVEVVFRFVPATFYAGLGLAASGLLGALVFSLRQRRGFR